jgi:membrane associated rhomboid family serine protease
MRYRLRTLLIVLAVGPPVLATLWWAVRNVTFPEFRDIAVAAEALGGAMLGVVLLAFVAARIAEAVTGKR